jgi:hypothetical protein
MLASVWIDADDNGVPSRESMDRYSEHLRRYRSEAGGVQRFEPARLLIHVKHVVSRPATGRPRVPILTFARRRRWRVPVDVHNGDPGHPPTGTPPEMPSQHPAINLGSLTPVGMWMTLWIQRACLVIQHPPARSAGTVRSLAETAD